MSLQDFKRLFHYDPRKMLNVGVEREAFIVCEDQASLPMPVAHEVLALLESHGVPLRVRGVSCFAPDQIEFSPAISGEFGYELSACQIESRTGPVEIERLASALSDTDVRLRDLLHYSRHRAFYSEVGPEDMSLDVYPDSTGRYQQITADMPREILLAACRVIGTHVHIGMPDHDTALRVYNRVIRHCAELCELGNGSFGERLAIYRQMAPNYLPPTYRSWDDYYRTASAQGFAEDPRKCWTLIRISVHGTIEFRMFDATDSIDRIVAWARRCHELCQEAMA